MFKITAICFIDKIFAEQEQGALDDRTGGWQAQRWTRSQVEAMMIISMIMIMIMIDTILIVVLIVSIACGAQCEIMIFAEATNSARKTWPRRSGNTPTAPPGTSTPSSGLLQI